MGLASLRDPQSLSVDVSDLLQHPGTTRGVEFDASLDGLAVQLAEVERGSEVHGEVRLDSLVNGVHVSGRVSGKIVLRCRRCLKDISQELDLNVNELFMADGEEAEAADGYEIEDDGTLNLEPMVRDAVVLGLPLNPLCKETCKGLCPVCGVDRNATECGHTAEPSDVRWGALERLREQMEG